MKIAMIGHKRIPSREGGVEIVVEELAARMVEQGHQVEVYNRKGAHVSGAQYNMVPAKLREYQGIRIFTIPTFQNKKLNAVVYAFLATSRALFGHYDVIHYHAEGSCALIWLPHLFGIKTVATIHGLDWQRAKWGGFATKFLLFGEKIAVKYADEIIVLSQSVKEYFMTTYGRETNYIPNGISSVRRIEVQEITEKYQLEKDGYLLFLARIVPEKGLHYLIEAYRELDTDMPLVIAGGSSHTDDYLHEIQGMAEGNPKIILTGFTQGRELAELYSNAYAYVLPSDVEGMPLSLLEAMSYGNTCLVSNISENMEVIGNVGYSFEKGNVQKLKEQLQSLINKREHLFARDEVAEYINNKYNWDQVVKETLNIYENINGK